MALVGKLSNFESPVYATSGISLCRVKDIYLPAAFRAWNIIAVWHFYWFLAVRTCFLRHSFSSPSFLFLIFKRTESSIKITISANKCPLISHPIHLHYHTLLTFSCG